MLLLEVEDVISSNKIWSKETFTVKLYVYPASAGLCLVVAVTVDSRGFTFL